VRVACGLLLLAVLAPALGEPDQGACVRVRLHDACSPRCLLVSGCNTETLTLMATARDHLPDHVGYCACSAHADLDSDVDMSVGRHMYTRGAPFRLWCGQFDITACMLSAAWGRYM
jgi:hypothetical protein